MKAIIKLTDKKVVYDDIDTLFIPFDDNPVLIHKGCETFPHNKRQILSIKVESIKFKKEEKDEDTS